jgi:hypothetical protein
VRRRAWRGRLFLGALLSLACPLPDAHAQVEDATLDTATPAPENALDPRWVDAQACDASDSTQAFLHALAVELAAQQFTPSRADPWPARLSVCEVSLGRVEVSRGQRSTLIDVSDVHELARPRTAAVAVAETLRWWDETTVSRQSIVAQVPSLHAVVPPSSRLPAAPPAGISGQATAASESGTMDSGLGVRTLLLGPQQSLYWGFTGHLGYLPWPLIRTQLAVAYLTTADESSLGRARLHVLAISGALELAFGGAPSMQLRVGVAGEWLRARAIISSEYGFDEPSKTVWAALTDVHATLAAPIARNWAFDWSAMLVKDVRGVALRAGGEQGISLHGWGVSSSVEVERAF